MNLPLGLVSILLMVRFCKRDTPEHAHQQLDEVGAVVLLCALSSLIFALNMLGSWGVLSGKFLLLLLAAILLLTLFFFLERKTKNPLINFSVLSDTSFIAVIEQALFCKFVNSPVRASMRMPTHIAKWRQKNHFLAA